MGHRGGVQHFDHGPLGTLIRRSVHILREEVLVENDIVISWSNAEQDWVRAQQEIGPQVGTQKNVQQNKCFYVA